MDMDGHGGFEVGDFFDTGSFDVICDPILYGAGQITLDYRIHSKFAPEDLSGMLDFIGRHYRKAYDRVLAGVLVAYQHYPKWDVWIDETQDFLRIDFRAKEELHPYIGAPIVDLAFCGGRTFWGLTFPGGTNKLSFEHGFCTVFEGGWLLALADNDFPLVLKWWDYYGADGNLLTRTFLSGGCG